MRPCIIGHDIAPVNTSGLSVDPKRRAFDATAGGRIQKHAIAMRFVFVRVVDEFEINALVCATTGHRDSHEPRPLDCHYDLCARST